MRFWTTIRIVSPSTHPSWRSRLVSPYIALSWENCGDVAARARRIREEAYRRGFRGLEASTRSWLGTLASRPLAFKPLGADGVVLGEVFPSSNTKAPLAKEAPSQAAWCQNLARSYWGRHVALFRDAVGKTRAVYRDPSGGLEAFVWETNGLQVVAASTPDWLLDLAPIPGSLDWERVGRFLVDPMEALGAPAFAGLQAAAPGQLTYLEGGGKETIWTPVSFVKDPVVCPIEAQRGLRERLDACIAMSAGRVGPLAAEASGGLDSAIVAGALKAADMPVGLWLNVYADAPETDERAYALALAGHLNLPITAVRRPEISFSSALFEDQALHPRPSQNLRDVAFDSLVADICRKRGVAALMTGKGGDALFFQMETAAAFEDLWHERAWLSLLSPVWPQVARRARRSVWSILQEARGRANDDDRASGGFLSPELVSTLRSKPRSLPWVADLESMGPGKRLQISALASGIAFHGPSRRTEAVDLLHPLLSQPLVEWGLRISVPVLTAGGHDRALARAAFADRLPDAIRQRQSKGRYDSYFNRQAAANLSFLRPYLLDGLLAKHGCFDRAALETALDRESLLWRGGGSELIGAAALEGWVRRWSSRQG